MSTNTPGEIVTCPRCAGRSRFKAVGVMGHTRCEHCTILFTPGDKPRGDPGEGWNKGLEPKEPGKP